MKWLWFLAGTLVLYVLVRLALPFWDSPSLQVEKAQRHLLESVQWNDWKKVGRWMDEAYRDAWDQDKMRALENGQEAFRGFLVLEILPSEWQIQSDEKSAQLSVRLKMEGKGMGVSQMVMDEVNRHAQPWIFHWEKKGWKPSDWRLIYVEHPQLKKRKF